MPRSFCLSIELTNGLAGGGARAACRQHLARSISHAVLGLNESFTDGAGLGPPYSLAFLRPCGPGDGGTARETRGIVRIGVLDEKLAEHAAHRLQDEIVLRDGPLSGTVIRRCTNKCLRILRREKVELRSLLWNRITDYHTLQQADVRASFLTIRFLSPTVFKLRTLGEVKGRLSLGPDVQLFTRSWVRRWNHFAPEPIEPAGLLEDVGRWVEPHRIQTSVKSLGGMGRSVRGMVGEVELIFLDGAPLRIRRHFGALARFAEYAGTGYRTSVGMGLTSVSIR